MADLFNNNTSNDYVYPDLPVCAGAADDTTFEFLPGEQVGIVSGSSIIAALGLGDVIQPVSGWVTQTKVLQPGELIFVQGLTKGITNGLQKFLITDTSTVTHSIDYMSIDLSINYYNSFRYYEGASISATSDYANGINIENALDIAFSNAGIKLTATYNDSSSLTFSATQAGYYYDIYNVTANTFLPNSSTYTETLVEDTSSFMPVYKYANTAMLGYVLKATYTDGVAPENEYIQINHVPDQITYYTTTDGSVYSQVTQLVDVGQSGVSCNPDTMSAATYLDIVESEGLWEKVGPVKIWLTAVDPADSNTKNLITGFYVYNPFSAAVKIDYMTIL